MADNLTTQSGTPATVPAASVIATDDVSSVHFQKVKLDVGGDGVSVPASGDATYGLDVDVTRVQGTVAVTGSFYQATQPVSGTVAVTGAYQATQPVSLATAPTTPVTGTFWQATQPVSGTVGVTGVATETTLSALNTKVTTVDTGAVTITGALPTGSNTIGAISNTTFGVTGTFFPSTQNVDVTANSIGLATSAKQTDRSQKSQITDGTRDATVKAASTAAVAADTALVVAISPNNSLNVANAPIASMVGGVSTATNGTSPFQVIASVASKQLAITSISVVNTGTAATLVTLQNGSGGTALYATMAPPGGGSNMTLPTPILTSSGTALFAVCAVASGSVTVCAAGYSV